MIAFWVARLVAGKIFCKNDTKFDSSADESAFQNFQNWYDSNCQKGSLLVCFSPEELAEYNAWVSRSGGKRKRVYATIEHTESLPPQKNNRSSPGATLPFLPEVELPSLPEATLPFLPEAEVPSLPGARRNPTKRSKVKRATRRKLRRKNKKRAR